jgi:predicted MFS family arabinose efflux permease
LITSALMLGVYTIVAPAAKYGWGAARTLELGAVSLALLGAFVLRQARARNPLIPLRIFRSRNVSGANVVQMLMVAGMFGVFFLGALYLQRVLGYDALEIGLAFLPATLVMGLLSLRYSERLIMRFGARTMLFPGLILIAAGLALFARAPVHGHYLTDVLPTMLLFGIGIGASFPSLMTLAMSGATREDAGLASGLVNTSAQVGGALGLAVLATLSATRTEHLLAGGSSTAAALVGGYHLAFLVGAGLMAVAFVVVLVVVRPVAMPAGHGQVDADAAGSEGEMGEAALSEAA